MLGSAGVGQRQTEPQGETRPDTLEERPPRRPPVEDRAEALEAKVRRDEFQDDENDAQDANSPGRAGPRARQRRERARRRSEGPPRRRAPRNSGSAGRTREAAPAR